MSEPISPTKKPAAAAKPTAKSTGTSTAPAAKAVVKKVATAKTTATKAAPVAKAKAPAKTTATKAVATTPKPTAPVKTTAPAKTATANRKTPVAAAPQASKKTASPNVAKKVKPTPAPTLRPQNEEKPTKIKLVRDSFTIPENEYAAIGEIKKACLALGVDVKRTEVIRAGLLVLQQMSALAIADYITKQLPKPKTGRPKKAK
jgi:hypothetical protein